MVYKGKHRNPYNWLLLVALIATTAMVAVRPGNVEARIDPNVEFVEFWSDYQSIFLYHPPLVRQIFLDIIDLKGNRRAAMKKIDSEILSCTSGNEALSACRIDQLKLERTKRKISGYHVAHINVTGVTGHPFKSGEEKYVLTIRWQPVMVPPPVMSISEFYEYLGAANESRYYISKKHLTHIQINPVFEERVSVVTTKARALNIMDLYRTPPADLKDVLVLVARTSPMKPNGPTASFDLHLRPVKIIINHMSFKTTRELLQ